MSIYLSLMFSAIIVQFLIVFLLRKCFVVVNIEHESMSPTLHDGDRVLVFRYWPAKWLQKGNIVLIWPWPNEISHHKEPKPFGVIPYIKRVIGLPGDTIVTSIDELDEYHKSKLFHTYDDEGKKAFYIPHNHFFVIGDYPIGGFDSRKWGPIPFESFLGVVVIKLSKP